MLSGFNSGAVKKRNQIIAIDLGARATKAVQLQRRGDRFELTRYAILDAPSTDKPPSAEALAEHLKAVSQALDNRGKSVVLVVGVDDALVRSTELPMLPLADMRLMLKYNSKNYLQQDLADYVFDCHILPLTPGTPGEAPRPQQKVKVLVGGAKKETVDRLQQAAKDAGLVAEMIVPGLVSTANAFELAMPEVFQKEVVALVDIGFKHSTISLLINGDLALSRVVGIGGDRITTSLAEAMGVTYAEAEALKIGVPPDVQMVLQTLLTPLGRELRASIDFFEHQNDKSVGHIYVSGGSACSSFMVETLQSELMVQSKSWNPASQLNIALPPQQMGEVEQINPRLAVAIGGAMAAF